ncbi:arginyltransferase [Mariniblastus sp.]|nr:arginyltransferase [Mariniblastus sp.]
MKPNSANDIIIIDETEPCPYLEGKIARMPLRMPIARVTGQQADVRLELGHRRTGEFIYETQCPGCRACEPIRIRVDNFSFSRNQRRVLNRGDRNLSIRRSRLIADQTRLDLFNRHRRERGLAKGDDEIDLEEYSWGFVRSCFDSFEFSYWLDDQLVGVAICDQGKNSISAVYTFYDPRQSHLGLGTYSLLNQIRYCQSQGLTHLYLGYFVEGSPHMNYKARFMPNERLIDGVWQEFKK